MSRESVAFARTYQAEVLLRDGGSVHLRALGPDDAPLLAAAFEKLSSRSRYLRFHGAKPHLSAAQLERLTTVDHEDHVALAATLRRAGDEEIIGVARYFRTGPTVAEAAFTVADAHQGRGLGTVLLEHLAEIARRAGVEAFDAYVLGENNRMLRVFADSGFHLRRSISSGVVRVSIATEETVELAVAENDRDRRAAAESLRRLFHPAAVAVFGASSRDVAGERPSIGGAILRNLRDGGFPGPIHPIHPTARTVAGLPASPSLADLPGPVDLAVVAVPSVAVEAVVEDCARAGVAGVVVVSAGFAERGPEGREVERRLVRRARGAGMRLVGPNCLGLTSTDPAWPVHASFAPHRPRPGNVGLLTQSGAIALAMLDQHRLDPLGGARFGLSSFVSVGNKADVSGNDLLAYWAEDPRTDVIALYLESFGNPRRFARLAPEIARKKPIVAVKAGRSRAGVRAAASHSAALASGDAAVDALFAQTGVIRTRTLEELLEVSELLATQPPPRGARVGVVTNAGGPGILFADAAEASGLELPELGAETVAALRPEAGLANPVDAIAAASPDELMRAIEIVGNDATIDALAVIYVPVGVAPLAEIGRAVAHGAAGVPAEKPVLTVLLGAEPRPAELDGGRRGTLPTYRFPENAAIALGAAARHAAWTRTPAGTPIRGSRFARTAIRAVVDRVLAEVEEPVWVEPEDLATVLTAVGIESAVAETVPPGEAAAVAERLGFPLVAKALWPGVVHKSDVGGVVLGLDSVAAVVRAVEGLAARGVASGRGPLDAVLLQREVHSPIEVFVGIATDPTFGPLVGCGTGGRLVELVADATFRLAPLTELDVATLLDRPHLSAKLAGYRGDPPGDRAALGTLLGGVSAIADVVPELVELDLNPILVRPPGESAVVVDGRMRLDPSRREGARR